MAAWTYFRWVLVIWGAVALLTKPVFFSLMGERWKSWLKEDVYRDGRRPGWVFIAATGSFLLIGYTWLRVWLDAVPYDWVLGVLMTVSAVKVITLLFDYQRFQGWVSEILADPGKEKQMILQVTAGGIFMLILAFVLY